ncbi:MAG: TonB family protein [Bryobacteraceae bacterium]|jgi:protein TonB
MAQHVDILDQPERLARWFAGSLGFHLLLVLTLLFYGVFFSHKVAQWGSPTGGAMGAVAVNPVARIPLPARQAAENPVANQTESQVPTPPPELKSKARVIEEEPDAISIQGRNAQKRTVESAPNKFRQQQQDRPNQLYSEAGQRMSSPMYGLQGGGGVGVGDSSPFGTQFGWYAKLMVDKVGRAWRTSDLRNVTQTAAVTFTVRRDGSVSHVHITQPSGNATLDFSAQRAIFDASPFPALPPQYPRNDAEVELFFSLK